jgi:lysozyme family protein
MSSLQQDVGALFSDLVTQLSDPGLTGPDREKVLQAAAAIKDEAFLNALANFRLGTAKFNELTTKLTAAAKSISSSSARSQIRKVIAKLGDLHAEFQEPEKPVKPAAPQDNPEPAEKNDETEAIPDPVIEPTVPSGGSIDGTVVTDPTPSSSTRFSELEQEYKRFFVGARFRSQSAEDETLRLCRAAAEDRDRYETVSRALGVPWWFIAAVHLLESGRNFQRHLHNGDKLTARTVQVPKGRPMNGNPPFTWEESATDALMMKDFHKRSDWSLARVLYRLEQYNGFGYRPRGIPTPYLWSLTTIYRKGKFSSDGKFDPNLVSKQCGAAAFLRGLVALGEIELEEMTGLDLGDAEPADSEGAVIKEIMDEPAAPPPVDHAFKLFFEENLSEVTNFRWDEFLTKGGSHHDKNSDGYGLNTDPPAALWPNVIELARTLQRFRDEIGAPVKLTSVYRSPAYNKSLSGSATDSQHMQFKAADIIAGKGTPRDWQKLLIKLRTEGVFNGGIGLYKTFVHVDVRGFPANWKGKGV